MIEIRAIILSDSYYKGVREMYEKGTYIRLHTSDSWNNLIGIVDEVHGDTIVVFCTLKPMARYFVSISDADKVLEKV